MRTIHVQERAEAGPGLRYRVLPKPYPVVGFQYRGRLSVLRNRQALRLEPAGITGLLRDARWFVAQPHTRTVLVTLQPPGAWRLFGVPVDELADAHMGLVDLMPVSAVRAMEESIAAAEDAAAAGHLVQTFLLDAARRSRATVHPALAAALQRLLAARGNVRVETLARSLDLGRRQLERLFRLQVGVSPREFAALARFEWAAGQLRIGRPAAAVAAEAGYADQAHLIRSFARRTGQTPRRFTPDDTADVAFVQSPGDATP